MPQQLDPFGQFLIAAFMQGKVPGHPTSAYNTVLDLISPGALKEREEQGIMPVGERYQNLFGGEMAPEEISQLIRQQTGMALTPMQEATTGLEYQKALATIVQNMRKIGLEEREVGVKEGELGVKKGEAERKAGREEAEQARIKAETDAAASLAEQRQQQTNVRKMAMTGLDLEGKPLAPEARRIAFSLARGGQQEASMLSLAKELMRSGSPADREFGANMIQMVTGLDAATIAKNPTFADNFAAWLEYFGVEGKGTAAPEKTAEPETPTGSLYDAIRDRLPEKK